MLGKPHAMRPVRNGQHQVRRRTSATKLRIQRIPTGLRPKRQSRPPTLQAGACVTVRVFPQRPPLSQPAVPRPHEPTFGAAAVPDAGDMYGTSSAKRLAIATILLCPMDSTNCRVEVGQASLAPTEKHDPGVRYGAGVRGLAGRAAPWHAPADVANLSPTLVANILDIAANQGISPSTLCCGLGFTVHTLKNVPNLKLSYRQISQVARRYKTAVGPQASGLELGAAQTPFSLGLTGVGMLTFGTVAEAVHYCLEHQVQAGAVLDHQATFIGGSFSIELTPRFEDPELAPFFVEEGLASILAIGRVLIGPHLQAQWVEVTHEQPANMLTYFSTFRCPIPFSGQANRIAFDTRWLGCKIATHDSFASDLIRRQLEGLLTTRERPFQDDFIDSAAQFLRSNLHRPISIDDVARSLNVSARTANRRLSQYGYSFRQLLDKVRHEQAEVLLAMPSISVDAVASAVGFADPSNFRRAYKRWTGRAPRGNRPRPQLSEHLPHHRFHPIERT